MTPLPVIISVPHGGEKIAPELSDRTLLSREDIFSDGDPLTREIYNFRKQVAFYFESNIARATVDLNRPPDDLPPVNPDGVVKSHTVTGKRVYQSNRVPLNDNLQLLLQKYYLPYHEGLRKKSRKSNLFCGIDCHTMLDRAPAISDIPGKRRPFICLSNRGDLRGNRVRGRRLTCPPEMLRSLAFSLKEQFPEEADNIICNEPFLGGYIIQRHSRYLPWLQIELNRQAYLDSRWFDHQSQEVDGERVSQLRFKFFTAIRNFVQYNSIAGDSWEQAA